jgi:hypothetical protein
MEARTSNRCGLALTTKAAGPYAAAVIRNPSASSHEPEAIANLYVQSAKKTAMNVK